MTVEVRLTSEGVGLSPLPPRDPAHRPIDWFQTDYDDQFTDPDTPWIERLPTARHRRVPGFDYGD